MGETWGRDASREAGMHWLHTDGKGRRDRVATPGQRTAWSGAPSQLYSWAKPT